MSRVDIYSSGHSYVYVVVKAFSNSVQGNGQWKSSLDFALLSLLFSH